MLPERGDVHLICSKNLRNIMQIAYPHTIVNTIGEKLTFLRIEQEPGGEKVVVENLVAPGIGPVMHTHFRQDESLTVVKGLMGYQIMGQEARYARAGESVVFERGTPHRFWNAGDEALQCTGWIQPANSIVFFLSALYDAMNQTGSQRPALFDGAYLIHRYRSEYDLPEMPVFVKKVMMPIVYVIGVLTGKYKKFEGAPEPLL